VEFWGTDIRVPSITSADNPYAKAIYEPIPGYAARAEQAARGIQALFSGLGFECIVSAPDLEFCLDERLFPEVHKVRQRIMVDEFTPDYPEPTNGRPLVVHATTHSLRKGSDVVSDVVRGLQRTHDFDFRVLRQLPRNEVLKVMKKCDIFLDQFVLGDHGLAALEAMAFGKPCVAYLRPAVLARHEAVLPIVNASQDTLPDVLAGLLEDGRRRHEIGRRSRVYVEKHHDAHKLARELVEIYEQLLDERR